jgi:hypothetical protein
LTNKTHKFHNIGPNLKRVYYSARLSWGRHDDYFLKMFKQREKWNQERGNEQGRGGGEEVFLLFL